MQALITQIASQMGIDEALAQKAVSIVLSLVQSQGDDGLVAQLFDKMPGASELASAGTSALGNSSSAGSGLMGMVGGLLGGNAGDIMSAISQLQSDGLETGQIKQVGSQVLDYAKQQGGEDLVAQITDSIPGLSKFL